GDVLQAGRPAGPPPPGRTALCQSALHYVWIVVATQKWYATGARYYAEVTSAEPHLLTDSPTPHRYRAACAAAMAGCGQGRDAADLDETTRVDFRRQARDWLRAELEARRRLLEQEPGKNRWTVARNLQDWLWDFRLAGVREPNARAQLSEPERQ